MQICFINIPLSFWQTAQYLRKRDIAEAQYDLANNGVYVISTTANGTLLEAAGR